MKLHPHLAFIVLLCTVACSKAPDTSTATLRLEERLQKMEAQLARIETAVAARPSETTPATPSKEQIKIYVSGSVAKPGEYVADKNISLLAAIAVAGGTTEYADSKKIKISRTGQDDKIIEDKSTFKDVILSDGDVVVVPQSMW
jgi:protein involved in polysaccharide export with SLBB domain